MALRFSRRARYAVWFASFAALALAAPHLPTAWGIGLAVALFAAGVLLPAKDCAVTPSAGARRR